MIGIKIDREKELEKVIDIDRGRVRVRVRDGERYIERKEERLR